MGEVNEDVPRRRPSTGQQRADEAAERGGGRLTVSDLLARVRPAKAPAASATDPTASTASAASTAPAASATDPTGAGPSAEGVAAAPTAGGEVARLAEIITAEAARLLPGGVMGPDTDFFDAGGTSVDAVALVAGLARDFGLELSLDDVFADARPRRLAARALPAEGPASRALPALTHGARADTHPGTHPSAHPDTRTDAGTDADLELILADLALADGLPWARRRRPFRPARSC